MNDSEFVDGLRRREPAAVRHLTEAFLPSVWRSIYVQVRGDHHLAEDIVGEAVLALLRAAAAGAEIQCPAAWLRSVAQHKLQDHFRAAARVQHLIEKAGQSEAPVDDNDAGKQHEHHESRLQIRKVMDELPEQHRLVLEWKYLDQRSVRDIATQLEVTEKAAESLLFRARREFREKFVGKTERDNRTLPDAAHGREREPNHSFQT